MQRIALPNLIEKLTILASTTDAEDLRYAFWTEQGSLPRAVRDCMEALMELARQEGIGWELNAGWRCDVPRDLYSIMACDNRAEQPSCFELQAATPQGALAGAILAILQARLKEPARE